MPGKVTNCRNNKGDNCVCYNNYNMQNNHIHNLVSKQVIPSNMSNTVNLNLQLLKDIVNRYFLDKRIPSSATASLNVR